MQAEYIEVEAGVRYWEDATINGTKEDEGGALIPQRRGDCWCPVIRLADGKVMEWPEGVVASVHYKVCDEGKYWLLDANRNRVAKYEGDYVPDEFLCHGDRGYGDYIILEIDGRGMVAGWTRPAVIDGQWEKEEAKL